MPGVRGGARTGVGGRRRELLRPRRRQHQLDPAGRQGTGGGPGDHRAGRVRAPHSPGSRARRPERRAHRDGGRRGRHRTGAGHADHRLVRRDPRTDRRLPPGGRGPDARRGLVRADHGRAADAARPSRRPAPKRRHHPGSRGGTGRGRAAQGRGRLRRPGCPRPRGSRRRPGGTGARQGRRAAGGVARCRRRTSRQAAAHAAPPGGGRRLLAHPAARPALRVRASRHGARPGRHLAAPLVAAAARAGRGPRR